MAVKPRDDLPQEVKDQTIFDWIDVSQCFVADYGRARSNPKINGLLAKWDERALGVILVSLRDDGTFAILDGQHRVEAAKIKGMKLIPARIYIDLSYEDEAELYLRFATVNRQSALDRFRARLEMKEPKALDVARMLEEGAGVRVDTRTARGGAWGGRQRDTVTAVRDIELIYDTWGPHALSETVGIVRAAWDDASRAWGGDVLIGIAMFRNRYQRHPDYDYKRLIEKCSQVTPESLLAKAAAIKATLRQSDSRSAIGRAVLLYYNEHLSARQLPDWADRSYSPEVSEQLSKRLIEMNKSRSHEQQSELSKRGHAARKNVALVQNAPEV